MTIEAYIDNALSFRINNWLPTQDGQWTGDGRLIGGEWLELIVTAFDFSSTADRWKSNYNVEARIPTSLRLVKTYTEIVFAENPHHMPQPNPPWYNYTSPSSSGPTTIPSVRFQNLISGGNDNQHFSALDESWRILLKVYFVRITHRILRDPAHNNLILRTSPNGGRRILIDA